MSNIKLTVNFNFLIKNVYIYKNFYKLTDAV